VDGETVHYVEAVRGMEGFLAAVAAELKARTFQPVPVRERMISKPGTNKRRRLGIPTVRDRVVQAALKLVLEPIFEADFRPCSYGFRPNRRAQDAIAETRMFTTKGYEWIVEGDIKACFDEISHPALMDRVRARIADKRILALVKAFLKSGLQLVKTVASNLTEQELTELLMRGARPAGPPPASPSPSRLPSGALPADAVIEVDRKVDDNGIADVGGCRLKIGAELARRRVTLRLDGHLVHVVCDGTLAKTMPSPVTADQRVTLRGARLAGMPLPPPPAGPVSVQRRIPTDGVVMVTRQQLRVGRTHAGKTVTIHVEDTHFRVVHNGEELSLHPRTQQHPVTRWRAYAPRTGT
jgi:hypothetical protein